MPKLRPVTFCVFTSTLLGPVISASARARSQCLSSPLTRSHSIWLYRNVQVVNRTGVGTGSRPTVMDGKLPAGRAAHREAARRDAVHVYLVMPRNVIDRLEEIDFTGKFVGVAIAAVGMQHESIVRREFTRRAFAASDEVQLAE